MGAEFEVNSLEEMCDMMCNNVVPKEREYYIFTFGGGQPNEGHYVKVYGDYETAREKMFNKYGDKWGFQYSAEEWEKWVNTIPHYLSLEKELEVIE